MAATNSFAQTKEIIEKNLKTPIRIGLKSNIEKWLGLDPKITMEDIYIKKYIERMNVLEIPLAALDNFFKSFLFEYSEKGIYEAILPDFSDFDLSNESIKLAIINHIEKAAKKRVATVLQSIENWESYFLNFFERDEDMLNELVENLFYRTGLVESSFKIINTRIVEENLYICYGKETPCGILKKEDYAASTLEKLNKIIQTCRYQTEKEFLETKVKEVDLKSKFEEIKKDKVFLKEVDKIIKIKIWLQEIAKLNSVLVEKLLGATQELEEVRNLTDSFLIDYLFNNGKKPLALKNGNYLVSIDRKNEFETTMTIKNELKRKIWGSQEVFLEGVSTVFRLRNIEDTGIEKQEDKFKIRYCIEKNGTLKDEDFEQLMLKIKETEEYWNERND